MGTQESCKWLSKWPGDGGQPTLTRRVMLTACFGRLLQGQASGLSNFDLSLLDDPVVPNELFFVRHHFQVPPASSAGWKLAVTGAVSKPVEIPFEELSGHEGKTLGVTLECAENPVGGGLVSHADWTGVPLASFLEQANPAKDASGVRLSGMDGFSRVIPISKAMHPDTLLVYRMNGERLPATHGLPLRAIVPGWYGMDSVKWLRGVEVLTNADSASAPRDGYVRLTRSLLLGVKPGNAVTQVNVKSAFSRPLEGAILSGRRFTIRGAAWAGENRVRRVEVSTDGAKSWNAADLASPVSQYGWNFWSYEWKIARAGQYRLTVRAEDDHGRQQPAERAPDRADGYELNAWQTVGVTVV